MPCPLRIGPLQLSDEASWLNDSGLPRASRGLVRQFVVLMIVSYWCQLLLTCLYWPALRCAQGGGLGGGGLRIPLCWGPAGFYGRRFDRACTATGVIGYRPKPQW